MPTGYCEDYPCCGHEQGDCNGQLYGSDESIKEEARKHFDCEHEFGFCVIEVGLYNEREW